MMARTQVTLDTETQRRARARAAELGISFAEYVRCLVEADLGGRPEPSAPDAVFDLGDSGGGDVAREKDRYLGEAVSGRRQRR